MVASQADTAQRHHLQNLSLPRACVRGPGPLTYQNSGGGYYLTYLSLINLVKHQKERGREKEI